MKRLQQTTLAGILVSLVVTSGCVSVKAPERIDMGRSRSRNVDTRTVPRTSSHEDARRKLGEAYAEIDYLRERNRKLEEDKRELKQDNDDCERRVDRLKDRYDD